MYVIQKAILCWSTWMEKRRRKRRKQREATGRKSMINPRWPYDHSSLPIPPKSALSLFPPKLTALHILGGAQIALWLYRVQWRALHVRVVCLRSGSVHAWCAQITRFHAWCWVCVCVLCPPRKHHHRHGVRGGVGVRFQVPALPGPVGVNAPLLSHPHPTSRFLAWRTGEDRCLAFRPPWKMVLA